MNIATEEEESYRMAYGQQMGMGFTLSALQPNPATNYKVCGGFMGETDANFGCQSLSGLEAKNLCDRLTYTKTTNC
jgi:hypothetical protein